LAEILQYNSSDKKFFLKTMEGMPFDPKIERAQESMVDQ
jgi:hypothetical protein